MSKMIEDTTSLHEPGTPWLSKPFNWPQQLKKYGLYHMTIGQFKPTHSMFKLSTDRIRGKVSDGKAKLYIKKMRSELIKDLNDSIYVESSGHMYGVLDLLDEVFSYSNFVFIIRDPRNWLRSAMNTMEYILYGPLDPSFLNLSLKASYLLDDSYYNKWGQLSRFEKYCWYYNKLNGFVLEKMQDKSNFKVYRHEDLFGEQTRDQTFTDMLRFASNFRDGFSRRVNYKPKLMDNKVHSNAKKKNFPHWREWNEHMTQILEKHCHTWMKLYGYGQEPEWQDKLD